MSQLITIAAFLVLLEPVARTDPRCRRSVRQIIRDLVGALVSGDQNPSS
jgi:hypothetical protein